MKNHQLVRVCNLRQLFGSIATVNDNSINWHKRTLAPASVGKAIAGFNSSISVVHFVFEPTLVCTQHMSVR
ncbi:MAG TPA: hypothetical protein VE868_09910 [Balneolaceae bacterium]|nr:hypothetical protein [Balneolaceae bacterium]